MQFRTIDTKNDRDTIITFRRDSFMVSYGSDEGLGDEDAYVLLIEERVRKFPEGLVLVEEVGKIIGQIELQIRNYEGRDIGYVNLFYLIPEFRGKGYGLKLLEYAENFFRKYLVNEYHLKVSPTNVRALRFYEKYGLKKLKEEKQKNVAWRMIKELETTIC
ncbi:GNAT family N-acetyltransferase [Paenibacillus solisilvae]|uniref:GNAT family N-acetyltransferase n=1 Tax=Paenibacillus solisilvae TaxID=2486751 RepID=A0ABW0VSX9_9BACL